jgi:hypothetical protein
VTWVSTGSQNAAGRAALKAEQYAHHGPAEHERGVAGRGGHRRVGERGLDDGVRFFHDRPEGTAEEQFLGHPVGARGEQHEAR